VPGPASVAGGAGKISRKLKVVIPFTDPVIVGRFVYHCDAANHEDKGMMGIVEVVSSQSTINPQEAGHAGHGHH